MLLFVFIVEHDFGHNGLLIGWGRGLLRLFSVFGDILLAQEEENAVDGQSELVVFVVIIFEDVLQDKGAGLLPELPDNHRARTVRQDFVIVKRRDIVVCLVDKCVAYYQQQNHVGIVKVQTHYLFAEVEMTASFHYLLHLLHH